MKRISVEQVLAAFEKSKAIPMRGSFAAPDHCLCPLAAVAYAEGTWATSVDSEDQSSQEVGEEIRKALQLDVEYFHGFIFGFDELECVLSHARSLEGFEDGKEAGEAVFARLWGRRRKITRYWERAPVKPLPEKPLDVDDDDIPF